MLRKTVPLAALLFLAAPAAAQESLTDVAAAVNRKVVKLFGSGGFRGVNSYGTGVIVSPKGHILTINSQLLANEVFVHLSDGRRLTARQVVAEPALDVALLKIVNKPDRPEIDDLEFFDITAAAKKPLAQPGDWVLAFSNLYQIAQRDEPLSVQRGVVAAYAKLHGRRGIFDAPYRGEVYVVDAVANNPGAMGGAVTTRTGEFLGLIGKELKNTLTETFINYAMPAQAKADVRRKDKTETVTLAQFVELAIQDKYIPSAEQTTLNAGTEPFTGIVLVPNVVERTPPYIESVLPNSPAATAGLKPDDLIVYIDGEPVGNIKALREALKKLGPGVTVKVEVRRGNNIAPVDLKLEEPKK